MRRIFFASICLTALAFDTGFAQITKTAERGEFPRISINPIDDEPGVRSPAKAPQSPETLLSRKEAELECLQDEVDRLRAATEQTGTMLIRATVVEVHRNKLGLKARDFDKMTGFVQESPGPAFQSASSSSETEANGQKRLVEANPARLPLFRELAERGAIRVLAEPNLKATSGRLSRFSDGVLTPLNVRTPEGETTVAHVWSGTKFEVLAVVHPNHRIRVKTLIEVNQQQATDLTDGNGTPQPRISSHGWDTDVELQFGQTLAIGSLRIPRPGPGNVAAADEKGDRIGSDRPAGTTNEPVESAEFIVFVTPELMTAPGQPGLIPAANQTEDNLSGPIAPAFDPFDSDVFGPPIPVMKRRTVRD